MDDHQEDCSDFRERARQLARELSVCRGECLKITQSVLDAALQLAARRGCSCCDVNKRFDYVLEWTPKSQHDQAEIVLEHALATYELLYGQEHPSVAYMLRALASLQVAHGKAEYGAYLESWGADILSASRVEPEHEFFHLFGYDAVQVDDVSPQ